MRASLATLALLVLVAGCPGPTFVVQQYGGPPRAREEIAILRVNGSDTARPVRVDGEDIGGPLAGLAEDARLHIEMTSGRHTVGVAAFRPGSIVEEAAFDAAPGRVYRVALSPGPRVVEVDRESDAIVRDVTWEPPPPVVRPRPPPTAEDAGTPL
ncbi:MAG TPA: hypothetical protein VIF62_09815 [Labilithrix sp.]